MTLEKGTRKDVTSPLQWDVFLYVLRDLDPRSLSLDGAKNPDKNGTQRELIRKVAKYDNDGGSKSDQKYRSKVIFRQQKVVNEWKNPSIYNKISS